jgi:AdoMet-dependent rRNA methyltransferase SPB1
LFLNSFEVVAAEDYPSDDSDDDNYTADMDIDEKARVMALAKKMINSQERNKVINASFNKFMFSDRPNLPWFVEDEENHNRPLMPVTEEEVAAEKGKLTGIDARNSKKVLEAKARKKRHMLKQLEKAKTKATQIFDNDEMTPGQKMKEVDKLYKRAKAKQKPQKVYVVARKFKTGAAGSGGGPTRTRVRFGDIQQSILSACITHPPFFFFFPP